VTTTLQWLAVDLLTGQIICDLPGVVSKEPNRRTLGRYESQSVTLAINPDTYISPSGGFYPSPFSYPGPTTYLAGGLPGVTLRGTDPSWVRGTMPGASALIAYRGDPGREMIAWGGVVLRRSRTLGNLVKLDLATPECYLDRRYTSAYTTASRDQNLILSDVVANFAVANQGLPITVQVIGSAGTVRARTYNDYDDKTVYSVLGDLAGLINGPEWTGHWQWARNPDRITPIIYVGNRIGNAVSPGLGPNVTFDESNLIEATLDEDYSTGKGANDVTAVSSGQGLARPQASSVAANFNGRPRFQYRYTPSTSIQDPLTLQAHADRAVGILDDGGSGLTLKASATSGPQLGSDWNLGDDIGYEVTGPAFPTPLTGVARCIGYESDDVANSPVLFIPGVI
jgi:hypothetical protein